LIYLKSVFAKLIDYIFFHFVYLPPRNARGGDGAEIIYSLRNTDALSKRIASEFEKAGQNVRKYYQRRLPSNPAKDYYYLLRNTPNNETIIVEYGFTDSTGDDVSQIKNNWRNLAEAVVKALASYVGVPYTVEDGNYYTVKSGDTLWNIAKTYGTTVIELKKINNLSTNNLNIGQKLLLPTSSKGTYIVKSGDTLYQIAQKYGITVNELKDYNNLTSNILQIDQILKIPQETGQTYIVKSGDTLYQIAQNYNITVNELKNNNNLTSDTLQIGQILKIPQETGQTYIVKSGDTLYQIAQKFNTTVNTLKTNNNLTSDILTIGMQLKV